MANPPRIRNYDDLVSSVFMKVKHVTRAFSVNKSKVVLCFCVLRLNCFLNFNISTASF